MSFRIKSDEDKGFEAFFDGLKALSGSRVKVGIQGAEASEEHSPGLSMLQLGLIHEFGATVKNGFGHGARIVIPQRSFIRSTADQNKAKYEGRLARAVKRLIKKPMVFDARSELFKLGEIVRKDIINRMRRGEITPEIAESTKKKRGENGPPLVDEGLLVGSIRSVVT